MGTLTADVPRLDSHCPHKLPTSCRLTSTPNCCACADERQHARTYRVYIDGLGFVQSGTRWQGYCWFCKEFWNNRLAATDPPLEPSQTRIPQVPDQTEFVARWNEFYQGYRIVPLADGSERRIAVLGEPLKEVSPGFLPRTLAQLGEGVQNDARRPENRFVRRRLSEEGENPERSQPSLEDALDSLLREASEENGHGRSAPDTTVTAGHESANQARLSEMRAAQRQRNEQFQPVFGSQEDIQRDDYESPLVSMYSRAHDRYRQAEERQADSTSITPPAEPLSFEERRDIDEQLLWGVMHDSQPTSESLEREGDVWSYTPATPTTRGDDTSSIVTSTASLGNTDSIFSAYSHLLADLHHRSVQPTRSTTSPQTTTPAPNTYIHTPPRSPQSTNPPPRRTFPYGNISNYLAFARTPPLPFPLARSLDSQPDRPPPLSDEAMTKLLACQVCYQQLANIAVVPCGHMVMCQWCAEIMVPIRGSQIALPGIRCPMCRRTVKQRVKIHM